MRQLIVNADDLGADPARNEGIAEGLERGVITSVSILVNGPAFADIPRLYAAFRQKHISWGLHLNLSEGKPMSPSLSVLTGPDGLFLGKQAVQQILGDTGNRRLDREIRLEIQAQTEVLRHAGIPIRHLDGHQHIHIFPAVIRAALDAAERNGIPWMRLPEEPPPRRFTAKERPLWEEADRFNALAQNARRDLSTSPVRTAQHFRGLYLKNRLTERRLSKTLATLPDGLTELMVHPGRFSPIPFPGPFAAFATEQRERELDILMSPAFRYTLTKNKIGLTPFPEISR